MGKGSAILQLLLERMKEAGVKPDKFTLLSIIHACCSCASLPHGKIVHGLVSNSQFHSDIHLRIALLKMYCKCNSLGDAHALLDQTSRRDARLWAALIHFYAQVGDGKSALHLFQQMQEEGVRPDKPSFVSILGVCSNLAEGEMVHAGIEESNLTPDVVVETALLQMYSQCGSLILAKKVFQEMPEKNLVSWTSMIAAYIRHSHPKVALRLFQRMQQEGLAPDRVAYISILDACANPAALTEGKRIHAEIVDGKLDVDVVLGAALISMYGRCGSISDAADVLEQLSEQSVVCWTAMITAYVQQGDALSAFHTFDKMQQKGLQPTKVTWLTVLDACTSAACFDRGRLMHSRIAELGLDDDVTVGTALIHMYGKCGCMAGAAKVFAKLPRRNVVTWNSIMAIHAQHGNGLQNLQLLGQMQWMGIRPNNVTFLNALHGCIHSGLIDLGCNFFMSLKQNDAIELDVEHYGCVIELLVRGGRMDIAEDLIIQSPFDRKDILWMTLLGARKL